MVIFVEDILSKNKIVAYHRTGGGNRTNTEILTAMMDIARNGYRIGNKGMYGDGLYCTYKLLDQYRDYLITAYGRGIVEVEILIKNYLCFEMGAAKFLFGSKYSLVDQIKSISPGVDIPEEVVWVSDALLKSKNIFDSSTIAKKFWTDVCLEGNSFRGMIGNLFLNSGTYIGKDLYKKLDHQDISFNLSPSSEFQKFARQLNVNGIMYVGKQDGHCVVVYEEGLKKVSFRRGCISLKQNYFDIPWFDLKSKETAESKKLELKNLLISDPIIGKNINLGEYKIIFKTVDGNVTDIYKKMKKDMLWLWEPYTSIINGRIEYDPTTREVNINSGGIRVDPDKFPIICNRFGEAYSEKSAELYSGRLYAKTVEYNASIMGGNATYVECESFEGEWRSGILNFDRLKNLSGIWNPRADVKIGYIWKSKKHYMDMSKFNNLSLFDLWKLVRESKDGEIIPK